MRVAGRKSPTQVFGIGIMQHTGNNAFKRGLLAAAGTAVGLASQSTWACQGFGSNGPGTPLNLTGGSVLNTPSMTVSTDCDDYQNAVVSGAGSQWNLSGILYVGVQASSGTMSIADGGKVSATSVVIGNGPAGPPGDGSVTVSGSSASRGVLETGFVEKGAGGAALLTFDGGILRATGNEANFLRAFSGGDINLAGGGAYIDSAGFNVGIASGLLLGAGGLTKLGAGTLTIAGANAYTGNTAVSAGTLHFDSYSQGAGQTLGIGASAGNSYGKLEVGNTATFAAGANIAVDVAGANTLASNQILSGVISAGTLNASTFNVTDNSALFNFRAAINGNSVDLTVVQGFTLFGAVLGSGASSAAGAAQVLDTWLTGAQGGDVGNIVTAFGRLATQDQVSRAVTQTLPLLGGGVTQSMLGMLTSFNSLLQNRMGDGASGVSGIATGEAFVDRQVWAKGFGSRAEQDDQNGASGFSANSLGMAVGVEGNADRDTRLGISYAYASSRVNGNTDMSGAQQRADVDSHILAAYGAHALEGDRRIDWQADLGRNGVDGLRQINFGGLDRTATSSYASYSAHAGAGFSKTIAWNKRTTFAPGMRVDYTWLRDRGYDESGADALNLHVNGRTTQALVLTAEGRLRFALTGRSWLSANLGVGYDAVNDKGDTVSVFAGAPGASFVTAGMDHSPWLISAGGGYTIDTGRNTQVSLRYDLQGRSGYLNQTASLRGNWKF